MAFAHFLTNCMKKKTIVFSLVILALMLTLASPRARAQFVYADIHDFASPAGYQPIDASQLTLWSDGNLYGTAEFGGTYGCGTIFNVSTSTYNDVFSFNGSGNPAQCGPVSGLTQSNGYLYGTTSTYSTVFRYNPSGGTMQVLHALPKSSADSFPFAPVVGKDGNLYGATRFLKPYRINATTGAYKQFSGSTLGEFSGPLYEASDLTLYGTTCSESISAGNTVFTMSLTGSMNIIYTFSNTDCPTGGLTQPNGATGTPVLYGVAKLGGANGTGYIFQLDTSTNVLTHLYDFSAVSIFGYNSDGAAPAAALLGDTDGNFYGTALSGGPTGFGTIFELKSEGGGAWSFLDLFDFTGGGTVPGGQPETPLFQHPSGVLYATAFNGGVDTAGGVAYTLTPFNPISTVTLCCNPAVILDQPVDIYGVNLYEVTGVTFAGATAEFQSISPMYLTAQVPAGAVDGQVLVTAINPASGLEETFSSQQTLHILPTITNLDPRRGAVGSQVLVEGGGFANASEVAFGGVPASSFSVQAPNMIVATVPTGAVTGKISVTTPNGTATSKQLFTVK